jgi:arylsulfatase A-like enzyme
MTDDPNIIFYVSDSLRADSLSCYGYERETSPQIDRLASDGVLFERAFSQAFKTVESSVSILTGLYPPTHGAYTTRHSIPEDAPRIAERLQKEGYATGGFSSLVQISRRRGFDTDFDTFDELFKKHRGSDSPVDWAKLCTDHVTEWLETVDEPFFAFIWSNGTHNPYAPRAGRFTEGGSNESIDGSLSSLRQATPEDASHVRDLYDDTIRHADRHFGRLLDHLKRAGVYEDTLIVLTADHGEVLSEHGRMEHAHWLPERVMRSVSPGFVDSQKLFEPGAHVGHLSILPYNELLHVPAILKLPDQSEAGVRRSGMVETVDLMPTVASVAGIPLESQGTTLIDRGTTTSSQGKDYVYSDTAISRGIVNFRSVRSEEHKLVRTDLDLSRLSDRRALRSKNLLASLLQKSICKSEVLLGSPDEGSDLASNQLDKLNKMRSELAKWLEQARSQENNAEKTDLDEKTEEQLKELGYLE